MIISHRENNGRFLNIMGTPDIRIKKTRQKITNKHFPINLGHHTFERMRYCCTKIIFFNKRLDRREENDFNIFEKMYSKIFNTEIRKKLENGIDIMIIIWKYYHIVGILKEIF